MMISAPKSWKLPRDAGLAGEARESHASKRYDSRIGVLFHERSCHTASGSTQSAPERSRHAKDPHVRGVAQPGRPGECRPASSIRYPDLAAMSRPIRSPTPCCSRAPTAPRRSPVRNTSSTAHEPPLVVPSPRRYRAERAVNGPLSRTGPLPGRYRERHSADNRRVSAPVAAISSMALRSKLVKIKPPSRRPSKAMTPSAKSPPASNTARPASTAG